MKEFNKETTYGEKYQPAMEIADQQEADAYFERLVAHSMSFGKSRAEAEQIERLNLGYWTGYYDEETARRVFTLFKCEHPIFGTSWPSIEEAFEAGVRMGQK
jgi:hypothetical protein